MCFEKADENFVGGIVFQEERAFTRCSWHGLHLPVQDSRSYFALTVGWPVSVWVCSLALYCAANGPHFSPQNIIAQSQSGTGKTAAFVLTMLSRVEPSQNYPQCICLAPTYELALQIGKIVETMGKYCPDIKITYAIRGSRRELRRERLARPAPTAALQASVAARRWPSTSSSARPAPRSTGWTSTGASTPRPSACSCWTRPTSWSRSRATRTRASACTGAVGSHPPPFLQRPCSSELNPDCQCLFFSATYDDEVMEFANKIVKDPVVYTWVLRALSGPRNAPCRAACRRRTCRWTTSSSTTPSAPARRTSTRRSPTSTAASRSASAWSSATCVRPSACAAFAHQRSAVQTKKTASWLAGQMTRDGHSVSLLSSELDIDQRAAVISRFRNGLERCLICTNVCARGIDIEQVTLVINFDMPVTASRTPDYETYLHRIGRTGRFGKSGLAINFIDGPQSRAILREIEQYFSECTWWFFSAPLSPRRSDMKVARLDAADMEALEKIDKDWPTGARAPTFYSLLLCASLEALLDSTFIRHIT